MTRRLTAWLLLLAAVFVCEACLSAKVVIDSIPGEYQTWTADNGATWHINHPDVVGGIEDGPNLYAFVRQNPWTGWDPDGLKTVGGYEKEKAGYNDQLNALYEKHTVTKPSKSGHGLYENGLDDQMESGVGPDAKKAEQLVRFISVCDNKISAIQKTAGEIDHFSGWHGRVNPKLLDDESEDYKEFKSSLSYFQSKWGHNVTEPLARGDGWGTTKEVGKEVALAMAAGKVLKLFGGLFGAGAEAAAEEGSHAVYQGIDKSGVVRYVGITERDVATRAAEHLAAGQGKQNLIYRAIQGAQNLTREQARVMEQTLINQYGLGGNGGQLLNKINSISPRFWGTYGISP